MDLTGRARPMPASRPSPAPSPAPPGVVPGSSPSRNVTAPPLRAAIIGQVCVGAAMALTVREDSTTHPCLCNQHRRRKPIGVGHASLLERLSQTCFGLLSDCAACGVLDG